MVCGCGYSWFGLALLPNVGFRMRTRQECLTVLAEAAGATKDHRRQLEALIELLAYVGLIRIEGDQVTAVKPLNQQRTEPNTAEAPQVPQVPTPVARAQPATLPGQIAFSVSVNISMADVATLAPEKITEFFNGIAAVMKVQAEIEKNKSGGGP